MAKFYPNFVPPAGDDTIKYAVEEPLDAEVVYYLAKNVLNFGTVMTCMLCLPPISNRLLIGRMTLRTMTRRKKRQRCDLS